MGRLTAGKDLMVREVEISDMFFLCVRKVETEGEMRRGDCWCSD